jgi:predicted nucleic acid-binding protein
VKRYVKEPGTSEVRALAKRRLAASALAAVEVPAAIWRRAREGDLPAKTAREIATRVTADLTEMIVVEARRSVIERAAALVGDVSLRAYDALQLASALHLAQQTAMAITFVCADRRLCVAAKAQGLRAMELR